MKQSDFLGSRTLTVDKTALVFKDKMSAQSLIAAVNASITTYLRVITTKCFYIEEKGFNIVNKCCSLNIKRKDNIPL